MKRTLTSKATLLAATFVIVCAGAASSTLADEATLYLAPYGFVGNLGGGGQVADGGAGTDFDLVDTFGLDSDERILGVDGFLHVAMFQFSFGYQENAYSGASTLSQDLDFNGATFPAGTNIRSEFDMKHYKGMVGLTFGVPMVSFGFIIGAHQIEVDTQISSSAFDEQEDFRIPVPAVGVTFGVHPLKQLTIHGEASGMSAHVSGIEERMIDAYASLEYLFLGGKFGITAGYRYFDLEASDDDQDNHVDLSMHGPYAGFALHL